MRESELGTRGARESELGARESERRAREQGSQNWGRGSQNWDRGSNEIGIWKIKVTKLKMRKGARMSRMDARNQG